MKHLIILILAIATIIAIRVFSQYKTRIVIAFLAGITIVSAVVTFMNTDRLMDLIRPVNQLFYQPDFFEKDMYPDAIFPLMLRGKTIYTKDDIKTYEYDMTGPPTWEYELEWIHHGINSENLFKVFGANPIRDASLNDVVLTDKIKNDFERLGPSNDMYRASSAVSYFTEEYGNYFHHTYMYSSEHAIPLSIYLHVEDDGSLVNDSGTDLVAIWEEIPGLYGENLYIMSRDYFDEISDRL